MDSFSCKFFAPFARDFLLFIRKKSSLMVFVLLKLYVDENSEEIRNVSTILTVFNAQRFLDDG